MKAITLVQPRPQLIALGKLVTETRPQGTDYRGLVAIHAAFWIPAFFRDLIESEPVWSILRAARVDVCALPRGMVVAVAQLVDCYRIESDCGAPYPPPGALEERVNEWRPGLFCWRFAEVCPLHPPITAGGRPGLWEWTPPTWWRDRLLPATEAPAR